ncbi:hypothetical protein ID866_8871 [Astraeus odoratus]|nr:hypothetical protein ID866_8871 [Astraeus odoratus]
MSPSPRDRQRAVKSQSMPIVPSVMQVMSAANTQSNQRQSQQGSPASINMSPQSKRSTPPPMTQPQGNVSKLPSPPAQPSHLRDDVVQEHFPPPPGPVHQHSQPNIHQPPPPQPPLGPMHSHSQPNIHNLAAMNPQMGYPRPVNRIAPPFLASFHAMEENLQMTDELMAAIERADYAQALSQQPPAPGTAGVAYAGGAQSGAVYVREAPSPHKDSVMDRVRGSGRSSPKDSETGRRPPVRMESQRERDRDVQPNESGRIRDRPLPASPGSSPQSHTQPRGPSPERRSPPYLTPQAPSAEGAPSGDYMPYKRESYQPSHARVPTPPTARKALGGSLTNDVRTTPPATTKLASQTPPLQAMKTRTPDKSLPVQEEQEDDVALKKSSGGHLQYDHNSTPHRDDDDDTLIENDNEYDHGDTGEDGGSGSYTPRSPSANLPEPYPTSRHYGPAPINQRVASIAKHHRNGSTDQLGLQSFDAIVNQKPAARPAENQPALRTQQSRSFNDARDVGDQRQAEIQQPHQQNLNYHSQRVQSLHSQVYVDDQNYDDPATAYLQTYFQAVRPNAPIPPTPHSQTAAPSPSPLVSSVQPSPAPVGSPYPFPFTHVRRNMSYAPPTAPSTAFDPTTIEEQLALQMQMYAMNNHAALTDSTFSPSSTPFPGPGYNPWAILQATRAFNGQRRRIDSMSMQSSPSHQPVSLPFPSSKGRGLKRRERSVNLRKTVPGTNGNGRDKVQPPPRVESTQPRDTSPEPYSSGEETAGEERYDLHEEAAWVDGESDADGDYISNVDKRRRTWEARWEALQQAFQALDFETDTTMILLAAPSHSTKLHTLTSRFVRREQLDKSPAMGNIRTAFKGIAGRRRAARTRNTSIVDRLLNTSVAAGEGSDAGSDSREGDLKRALETTLGSLGALRSIYEHRVSRWEEEMRRIMEERERVDLLLHQTLGVGLQQNGAGF